MVTVETEDYFSSANGKGRDKAKKFFAKNDILGKAGSILSTLGSKSGDATVVGGGGYTPQVTPSQSKSMSKGTKTGLIVGAVLVAVGVGYYFYTKNKK